MKSIGIVVREMYSQLAYEAIKELNEFVKQGNDAVLFYENLSQNVVDMNFASVPLVNAYIYPGILIATDVSTAHHILTCLSTKKYFYVWDLEWLRHKYPYEFLVKIYRDPRIKIINRSEEYAKLFENCWNRQSEVLNMRGVINYVN